MLRSYHSGFLTSRYFRSSVVNPEPSIFWVNPMVGLNLGKKIDHYILGGRLAAK